MTVETISCMKVWDWIGIELTIPESADELATECATGPAISLHVVLHLKGNI